MSISGTPGVEKTLTAEAVSEHLQRPLYSVRTSALNPFTSCPDSSDLGRRIESRLSDDGSPAFARLPGRPLLKCADSLERSRCIHGTTLQAGCRSQQACLGVPSETRILRGYHVPYYEPSFRLR